jgi:hypothetical protein
VETPFRRGCSGATFFPEQAGRDSLEGAERIRPFLGAFLVARKWMAYGAYLGFGLAAVALVRLAISPLARRTGRRAGRLPASLQLVSRPTTTRITTARLRVSWRTSKLALHNYVFQ